MTRLFRALQGGVIGLVSADSQPAGLIIIAANYGETGMRGLASLYAGLIVLTLTGLAAVYTIAAYREGVEAVRLQWQLANTAAAAAEKAKIEGNKLVLPRPADVVLVGPNGDVKIAPAASIVRLPWNTENLTAAVVVATAGAGGQRLLAAARVPLPRAAPVDVEALAERVESAEKFLSSLSRGYLDPLFVEYMDVLDPNAYRGFIYVGEIEVKVPVTVRLYRVYPCSMGNRSLAELRVGNTVIHVEYLGGETWLRSSGYRGQHPLVGRIYVYVNSSLVFAGGGKREEPNSTRLRIRTGEGEATLTISTGPPWLGPRCSLTGVEGVYPNFLLHLALPAKGVTVKIESGPVVGFYRSSYMLPSLYYAIDAARLLGAEGRLVVLEQPRSYQSCSGETLRDKRVIDTASTRQWVLEARIEELDSSRWRLCPEVENRGPARYIVYRYEGFAGSLTPVIRGSAFKPG